MTETREEVQARWWAAWREQDFSWAGLAAKPVGKNVATVLGGLHGERSLQDYWRRDPTTGAIRDDEALLVAGELLRAPDDTLWHVVHAPWTWADGVRCKAGWNTAEQARLTAIVAGRLAVAKATAVDVFCNSTERDGRAQLQGAVLIQPPTDQGAGVPPLVISWSAVPRWDAQGASIAAGFCCDYANFLSGTRFRDANFNGDASFSGAIFSGYTSFDHVTFARTIRFFRASFVGYVSFSSATFYGGAEFDSATFSDSAEFFRTTFASYANFLLARFSGYANFENSAFGDHTGFYKASFLSDARFDDATFSGRSSFSATIFSCDARFKSVVFSNYVSFATARFRGLAYFTAIKAWPPQASGWHRAFFSTEFARTVDFEGSSLHALAAFDGIRIAQDASLLLDDLADDAAKVVFRQELRAALEQGWRDAELPDPTQTPKFLRRIRALLRLSSADRKRLHAAQDIRLKELERGCRALVVEMEKLRDRTRAQLFYRFEIEARRRQHETPRWEKITSWLYDKLGDYGASIARPLAALLLSIPMAAPLYGGILAWQRPALCTERLKPACDNLAKDPRGAVWPIALGSLGFSASRALPFGAWEVKAEDPALNNPVRMLLLGEADTWQHVLIRALGTLHSVFALAMAFLSGIAIRRRFQLD